MPDENKNQENDELKKLLGEEAEEENNDGAGDGDDKGGKPKEGAEGDQDGGEGDEGGEADDSTKIKPNGAEDDEEGEEGDKGEGDEEDEFKGKSREEVIKMLKEQREKAAKPADDGKGKKKEGDEEEDDAGKEPVVPTPEELQKMTPSDFANWVLARIDEGVKRTIESQGKVQSAVRKEIAEAKKEHNLKDPDYRKMVLTIIEAASAKGTTMPLKDACKQVDAFLGKHAGKTKEESDTLTDEEKSRLKKAKAQVESGAGAPTKPDSSDAETKSIQKALGGSGHNSPLGGLGI